MYKYYVLMFLRMNVTITDLQSLMCSHDIVCKVAHYLSSNSDDVVREVLALLAKLLYNGNRSVQVLSTIIYT